MNLDDPQESGKSRFGSQLSRYGVVTVIHTLVAHSSQYTMIQRVHPNPLRVSSITRWPGAPPVHQRTFYGTPALALPTRPISTSSAKTTRARSRASGSHRGPFVIIREVGKGRGLSPGTIVGGAFLAVIGEITRSSPPPTSAMTDSTPSWWGVLHLYASHVWD